MHKYNPPAYRILITDSAYSSIGLKPYDSASGDGPIYHDVKNNVWYRNGKYTGEFLIDRDIPLDECISIEFINHHKTKCKKYGSNCIYRNSYTPKIGARFISSIVSRDLRPALRLLAEIESEKVVDINWSTREAINYLLMKICINDKIENDEILSLGDLALGKAILNAYAIGDENQATIIANILQQSCSVRICLINILAEFFIQG